MLVSVPRVHPRPWASLPLQAQGPSHRASSPLPGPSIPLKQPPSGIPTGFLKATHTGFCYDLFVNVLQRGTPGVRAPDCLHCLRTPTCGDECPTQTLSPVLLSGSSICHRMTQGLWIYPQWGQHDLYIPDKALTTVSGWKMGIPPPP